MNDEWSQLERRLEQATAGRLPAGTTLDSETAALREGWLAMAQLLEAVDSASASAATLQAAPPRRSRRRWKAAVAAAVAASLLVAGALAWRLSSGRQLPEEVAKDHAPLRQSQPLRATERDLAATHMGAAELSSEESLDEDITRAYRELIRVEQGWQRLGAASAPLSKRLEELGQELAQSTI